MIRFYPDSEEVKILKAMGFKQNSPTEMEATFPRAGGKPVIVWLHLKGGLRDRRWDQEDFELSVSDDGYAARVYHSANSFNILFDRRHFGHIACKMFDSIDWFNRYEKAKAKQDLIGESEDLDDIHDAEIRAWNTPIPPGFTLEEQEILKRIGFPDVTAERAFGPKNWQAQYVLRIKCKGGSAPRHGNEDRKRAMDAYRIDMARPVIQHQVVASMFKDVFDFLFAVEEELQEFIVKPAELQMIDFNLLHRLAAKKDLVSESLAIERIVNP